jgi:hypothetical protein
MLAGPVQTWITRQIAVRQRLERICASSLRFLMVATTTPALQEAARFAGRHTALFSNLLKAHAKGAITTLEPLSHTQARQCAKARQRVKGLPWKSVILIDRTRPPRASLPPANAQTFHHGQGDVLGPQWTHIVLVLGAMLIPLPPIPC